MKLYLKPGACSLSPHIVLEEAGLTYDTEAVDLAKKVTASGVNFFDINPKGYVPALTLDDGSLLTEGPAIVQYLADLRPEAKLAPANGTLARYQLQSWLTYIGTELHKNFMPFFIPGASDGAKANAQANLQRRFALVESELASKPYLMGEDFTVADAYLFTVTSWAQSLKHDMSAFPRLMAYQARVASRPAVQRALKAEGLV